MLQPITIRYPIRPRTRSLMAGQVSDLFGLSDREPPHAVASNVILDLRPGDVALFTGPSGSGKSSLMRAAAAQCSTIDAMALILPDTPLIEALDGTLAERLSTLAACGLSEARLLLRTPDELSDGQRYRFRIALALTRAAKCNAGTFIILDEFTAMLDRTLAKVVAFNLRKLATRTGNGVLAATTHDDILPDLQPDLHIQCSGDSDIVANRDDVKKKALSLSADVWMSEGTVADWAYFARWHYRSHRVAFVRRVRVLWWGSEPIGICIFTAPAASLSLRSRYFGLSHARSGVALSALNTQMWLLSRVVLHPTWRGAGVAAAFVRAACRGCPVPWIETLSAMGQANPFFERAGFQRVGIIRHDAHGTHGVYAGGKRVSAEMRLKSQYSEPIYYVYDNRRNDRVGSQLH